MWGCTFTPPRGLDIKTLRTVVNYDAAKDIDTHVHRYGECGECEANSFLTAKDNLMMK